jgi:hypothetical protein
MKLQTQDIIDNASLGFTDMPVRFFIYDTSEDGETDLSECNEQAFLEAEGVIEYERHTVFQNGCKQICLTKNPY